LIILPLIVAGWCFTLAIRMRCGFGSCGEDGYEGHDLVLRLPQVGDDQSLMQQ
jgi:hypothetical protein